MRLTNIQANAIADEVLQEWQLKKTEYKKNLGNTNEYEKFVEELKQTKFYQQLGEVQDTFVKLGNLLDAKDQGGGDFTMKDVIGKFSYTHRWEDTIEQLKAETTLLQRHWIQQCVDKHFVLGEYQKQQERTFKLVDKLHIASIKANNVEELKAIVHRDYLPKVPVI